MEHRYRRLLVATTNAGKLREIREILRATGIELLSLDEVGKIPEPEETGATFAENSRLKARYDNARTGLPSVADDSGIEIDALNGALVKRAGALGIKVPANEMIVAAVKAIEAAGRRDGTKLDEAKLEAAARKDPRNGRWGGE